MASRPTSRLCQAAHRAHEATSLSSASNPPASKSTARMRNGSTSALVNLRTKRVLEAKGTLQACLCLLSYFCSVQRISLFANSRCNTSVAHLHGIGSGSKARRVDSLNVETQSLGTPSCRSIRCPCRCARKPASPQRADAQIVLNAIMAAALSCRYGHGYTCVLDGGKRG